MPRWSALVVWIVLTIAALAGALITYQQGARTRSWESVEGEVLATAVETRESVEAAHHYEPMVSYRYTVDGQEYLANEIVQFDVSYSARSEAEEVTADYRSGSSVTVYYDPADPASALLEPGVQPMVPIGFGVAALMMFAFAVFAYRELVHGRSPR